MDAAARWTHSAGPFDWGLSYFHGTSREPTLSPALEPGGAAPVLVPFYEVISQTGLEFQATIDSWLWKLEAIRRAGQGKPFMALTAGFEYTFVGFAGSSWDVGVLAEGLWDERGEGAGAPFERDLFAGTRIAFNNAASTEVLAGVIRDDDGDATLFSFEAAHRLSDRWKLEVEARGWGHVSANDPQFAVKDDDHLEIRLQHFF